MQTTSKPEICSHRKDLNVLSCGRFSSRQVRGSLVLRAALQVLLVSSGPALSRSVSRRFPQSPLHLASHRTPGVHLRHWWKADGSEMPRPPPLSDHFCFDPASSCHSSTSLRPQTACDRPSGQTCAALDLLPLLPPSASVETNRQLSPVVVMVCWKYLVSTDFFLKCQDVLSR